jgi:hypothetical protein
MSRMLLVTGSGRCGLLSLAALLNGQPGTKVTLEEPPLLPWRHQPGDRLIRARLDRLRRRPKASVTGDAAAFYLPYLADALAIDPELRVLALRRPRAEVVASFGRFLDEHNAFPTDHWSDEPAPGFFHDPLWTRTFPQYDTADRAEGIGRYWDECERILADLAARHPDRLRVFDMREALGSEAGQRHLLDFAGYAPAEQVVVPGLRAVRKRPQRQGQARYTSDPRDPGRCAVLVPYAGFIHPPCEAGLRELERRGYIVRRVGGYAAVDQARNQAATDALLDGFAETMWIDADVEFAPDAVDRLRAHGLPIACGIYPQKGRRAIASNVLPGTPSLTFGQGGGLHEILYAGAGFLHVRREVYLRINHRLALPLANERFGSPVLPFFQPLLLEVEDGQWYLAEDYAFCERARRCGYRIVADTTIRLWHHGGYGFGWEDSGTQLKRNATFTLHLDGKPPGDRPPAA